ncbi:30S ribosomal protein S16 [Candidatus Dependentiae bacterium]|nr:30S ribosomal protein S16 [Candidatus Dependentiae bacterium]
MAVKIRFARIGKKHAPIYKIVAIDSRKKRDGMFLEDLGTYNPKTKQIVQFHDDRLAYWMSVGATPTDAVARLIAIKQKVKSVAQEVVKTEKKAASKKTVSKKTTTE